jgi:hypothetical protein
MQAKAAMCWVAMPVQPMTGTAQTRQTQIELSFSHISAHPLHPKQKSSAIED